MSVFTKRSICLYCKTTSAEEFHDIYDEIGTELELPKLVALFFKINVQNSDTKQVLCDVCVNHLIELYDLEEHCKDVVASVDAACQDVQNATQQPETKCKEDNFMIENAAENPEIDVELQDDGAYNEMPYEESSVADDSQYDLNVHDLDDVQCKDDVVANTEYGIPEMHETNLEQHFNTEHENNDEVEEAHDDEGAYSEMPYEESSVADSQDHGLATNDELDCFKSDCDSVKSENVVYEEVVAEEDQKYDIDGMSSNYMAEIKQQTVDEICNEDSNEIYNEAVAEDMEENSMDIIDESHVLYDMEEEEYLIEEPLNTVDYDNVNLNEYLDSAINTNFEDLQVDWTMECNLCLYKHYNFQDLIKHPCVNELNDETQLSCIIKDCNYVVTNRNTLARHLIVMHYDNVQSLPIYGRCPECQKPFSNLTIFNKHSCSKLRREAGARVYCQACNLDFQSLKRYFFHMQFHLARHRPKICLLCDAMFNNIDDFFEHVTYTHEPESTMACVKCDRFFKDPTFFQQHLASHEKKYVYECTHCPKKYSNRGGLASHMDLCHHLQTKTLQCDYCYEEFINQSHYRSHIRDHMAEARESAHICSVCGLLSKNSETIKNHLETDKDCKADGVVNEQTVAAVYACESCSLDFFSQRHLYVHRQSSKHNGNVFICPICRKKFNTLKHMRNHLTSHKEYDDWQSSFPVCRMYMCNIGKCFDAYLMWSSLYYHRKRHQEKELNFNQRDCQFCGKNFNSKMAMAIHVARAHNNSFIKCEHCAKTYKTNKELQEHIDYMHVQIACAKCGKSFKNGRNLRSHEKLVHEKEKRYFCGHCNKGYYYKSEMEAHEKNVHPKSSYKCELCTFVTNYPKSLEIHMAKHTKELPFKCPTCSKGFARKALLEQHKKRHKKEKDFICYEYCENGCNASFITHFLLRKHIASKHAEKEEEDDNKVLPQKRTYSRRRNKKNQHFDEENVEERQVFVIENEHGEMGLLVDDESKAEFGSDDEIEIHYETEDDAENTNDILEDDIIVEEILDGADVIDEMDSSL